MGFGGPVWHASVSPFRAMGREALRAIADEVLRGVGDPTHQWEEVGHIALHVRRRLNESEARVTGPVVDIRGTWEATKRQQRMRKLLPPAAWIEE